LLCFNDATFVHEIFVSIWFLFKSSIFSIFARRELNLMLDRNLQYFCLKLWCHYDQQIIFILIYNLFSGEGHLYTSWTTETLELILGELHVSIYRKQRKIFCWIMSCYFNFLSSISYIEPEPLFHLHMEFHTIVIELTKFRHSHN